MEKKNIKNIVLETLNEAKDETKEGTCKEEDLGKSLEELNITSIAFIKFVILLEEKLGFEMPDEFLLFLGSNTVQKMIEVIEYLMEESHEL